MADQQNDPWAEPVEKPPGRRPRGGRSGGVNPRLLGAAAAAIVAAAAAAVVIASGGSGKSSGSNLASNTSTRSPSTTNPTTSSGANGAGVSTNDASATTNKSATTSGGTSTGGGTPTIEVSAASNPKEWGELFDLYNNFEVWAEGAGGSPSSMFTANVTQTGLTSPGCGTVSGTAALAAAYSGLGGAEVSVNTPDSFPVAGRASDFTMLVSIGSRTVRVHFDTAELGHKWLISAISGPCV